MTKVGLVGVGDVVLCPAYAAEDDGPWDKMLLPVVCGVKTASDEARLVALFIQRSSSASFAFAAPLSCKVGSSTRTLGTTGTLEDVRCGCGCGCC